MRYLIGPLLLFTAVAYADQTPPGFEADPSLPTPQVQVAPSQQDNTPASVQTNNQWQAYDQPIRECIEGDTIFPTKDNKVLSYLFNNTADTNATMSILGWKKNQCNINFTEGTYVKYCQFDRSSLKTLLDSLLNPDLFDPNGDFAQQLTGLCKDSNATSTPSV